MHRSLWQRSAFSTWLARAYGVRLLFSDDGLEGASRRYWGVSYACAYQITFFDSLQRLKCPTCTCSRTAELRCGIPCYLYSLSSSLVLQTLLLCPLPANHSTLLEGQSETCSARVIVYSSSTCEYISSSIKTPSHIRTATFISRALPRGNKSSEVDFCSPSLPAIPLAAAQLRRPLIPATGVSTLWDLRLCL
jgi:hypothetical protein